MALIIEHGGGGGGDWAAGAIQGLAGFAQGQEAGRLRRIEEERAERAENRTKLAAQMAMRLQQQEYDQSPRLLKLKENAQKAEDDAREKAHAETMAEIERRMRAEELAAEDRAGGRVLEQARIDMGTAAKDLAEFQLKEMKKGVLRSMPDDKVTHGMIITQVDSWATEFPDAFKKLVEWEGGIPGAESATLSTLNAILTDERVHPTGHELAGDLVITREQRLKYVEDITRDLAEQQVTHDAKAAYEGSTQLLSDHMAARERAEAQGAPTNNFLSDDEAKALDQELESAQNSANPVEALRAVQKRITEALDLSDHLDARDGLKAGILGQVESRVEAWVAAGPPPTGKPDPLMWSNTKGEKVEKLLAKLRKTSAHSNEVETIYHEIMSILDPNHGNAHSAAVAAGVKGMEKRMLEQGQAAAEDIGELEDSVEALRKQLIGAGLTPVQ